jgi:hypothetical protein
VTGETTVIKYGPRGREAALLVARYLDVQPEFVLVESLPGRRVVIEAGADLVGVRGEPGELPAEAPLEPTEEEGEPLPPPPSSTAADGADGANTSTTVSEDTSVPTTETTVDDGTDVPDGSESGDAEAGVDAPPTTSLSGGVLPIDREKSESCGAR